MEDLQSLQSRLNKKNLFLNLSQKTKKEGNPQRFRDHKKQKKKNLIFYIQTQKRKNIGGP